MENPFQILGVTHETPLPEVRRIYLSLAHKFHPDKNPGDKKAEEKFKEINYAWEQISDPKKRARWIPAPVFYNVVVINHWTNSTTSNYATSNTGVAGF